MVAVSAVACSQPTLSQKVSNQEIANALQNYFVKNENLLNGSTATEQNNNLFETPINEISCSAILDYIKSILSSKPNINVKNLNYNLYSIAIQISNKSNYNEVNVSISFKLTYNGLPVQNFSVISNLLASSNFYHN